jgi:hypothetical protein
MPLTKYEKIKSWIVGIAIVSLFLYFGMNTLSYFDPINMCYINIEKDVLSGNRETIKKAIKMVKRNSSSDYRNLCKYISNIQERHCMGGDWHFGATQTAESIPGYFSTGCYILGTKTIYLLPEENDSASIIEKRANALIKYSAYSKDFWTHKK